MLSGNGSTTIAKIGLKRIAGKWRIGYLVAAAILAVVALAIGQTEKEQNGVPCGEIITTLVPQRITAVATSDLQRLEIRGCETHELQFVAWERSALKPALVFWTPDTNISQLTMSRNVFVVETTGGSHSIVLVFVYDKDGRNPRLAVNEWTKGGLTITSAWDKVSITYPSLSGDSKSYSFPTGR